MTVVSPIDIFKYWNTSKAGDTPMESFFFIFDIIGILVYEFWTNTMEHLCLGATDVINNAINIRSNQAEVTKKRLF